MKTPIFIFTTVLATLTMLVMPLSSMAEDLPMESTSSSRSSLSIHSLENTTLAQNSVMRVFPRNTYWAKVLFDSPYGLVVDRREILYAPGLQASDESNRLIPASTLMRREGLTMVRVKINSMGQIQRMWILTPAEIEQLQEQDS